MAKKTIITLGEHFDSFISSQRVAIAMLARWCELVRAGLQLLQEHEKKVGALRLALEEGSASGDAGPLDFAGIRRAAREQAGLRPVRPGYTNDTSGRAHG